MEGEEGGKEMEKGKGRRREKRRSGEREGRKDLPDQCQTTSYPPVPQ